MQLEFLVNRQYAIPTIGRWYHQDWDLRLRGDTEQQCIDALNVYLNSDQIPFILVATENAEIVGARQAERVEQHLNGRARVLRQRLFDRRGLAGKHVELLAVGKVHRRGASGKREKDCDGRQTATRAGMVCCSGV